MTDVFTKEKRHEIMAVDYSMRISRMTVDKLGVKLYDRVYAVIAELISNSYDADATEVTVTAPMGQFLATKSGGNIISKDYEIVIEDNGSGMSPQEVQDFFLFVGKERRNDQKRGDTSPIYKRKVMGRKGIGKLAPFGVCGTVEVISAGGKKIKREQSEGFLTAHIILEKKEILNPTEDDYKPKIGRSDDTLSHRTFTKIILKEFDYRKIGAIDELSRQLAQRFGIQSSDWKIKLDDSAKAEDAPDKSRIVGDLIIKTMNSTKITFVGPLPAPSPLKVSNAWFSGLYENSKSFRSRDDCLKRRSFCDSI